MLLDKPLIKSYSANPDQALQRSGATSSVGGVQAAVWVCEHTLRKAVKTEVVPCKNRAIPSKLSKASAVIPPCTICRKRKVHKASQESGKSG